MNGNKLRRLNPTLAGEVAGAWQIPAEAAAEFADPMTDCLMEWFPASLLENTARAILPLQALTALGLIYAQCTERQRLVFEKWGLTQNPAATPAEQRQPERGEFLETDPEPGDDLLPQNVETLLSDYGGIPVGVGSEPEDMGAAIYGPNGREE